MELKEIKCKNCDANLEVEENQKIVKCKYCNTEFSIEDDYSKAYNSTKGALDASMKAMGMKHFKAYSTTIRVILAIVFIFVVGLMIFGFTNFFNSKNSFDIESFNSRFEHSAGRKNQIFIGTTLDDIVTSNKKNSHKITVIYNGKETEKEEEINKIRDSLIFMTEYNISIDYDRKGYVSTYKISDIKD